MKDEYRKRNAVHRGGRGRCTIMCHDGRCAKVYGHAGKHRAPKAKP
jgi:hypothetical protein